MENKIDATLSKAVRDQILDLIQQIRTLLPFLVDLTPEERQTLFKMGESGRPFVEAGLNIVEQDDSFMPRSFDKAEMREDNELYEAVLPVYMAIAPLFDAIEDTMMLIGSDLIQAGLEVYRNARANGKGENLEPLIPLLSRRFKHNPSKKADGGEKGGENPQG